MTLFKDMVWKEVCSDVQGTVLNKLCFVLLAFDLPKKKKKEYCNEYKINNRIFYKLKCNETSIIIMSKHFLAIILIFQN